MYGKQPYRIAYDCWLITVTFTSKQFNGNILTAVYITLKKTKQNISYVT